MKQFAKFFVASLVLVSPLYGFSLQIANSHGGGLDSQGGHNCNVGSCAGTYHCHQARGPGCGGGTPVRSSPPKPISITPVCIDMDSESLTKGNVAAIQKQLKNLGYYKGKIDGALGAKTTKALNRFEVKKKIKKSPVNSINNLSIEKLGADC